MHLCDYDIVLGVNVGVGGMRVKTMILLKKKKGERSLNNMEYPKTTQQNTIKSSMSFY